jgi:hypothetical protein
MNIETLNWVKHHKRGTKVEFRKLEEIDQLGGIIHIWMEISQGNFL